MDKNITNNTRAVLVSLIHDMTAEECEKSLEELEKLLETAGGTAAVKVFQNRESPDTRTYIGKGKAEEIAELIANDSGIDLVVFDNELTPSQIVKLEDIIKARVIDRTMLILDIFALHAITGEGKLQVEIACLRYTAPRLVGKGKELSRLAGGIGTRGPGESKLESDRRHIKRRINALHEQLKEMEKNRFVQRSAREKSGIKTIAIVGYTNAGKSTLLNYLTGAGILAEDKLFATLDPTTRRLTLPDGQEVLLTDTVGFIDRLPTHLVKAFKSTLEEVKYADIILNITDGSEPEDERRRKRAVTEKLIGEFGGEAIPVLDVYNKIDSVSEVEFIPAGAVNISAKEGTGVDILLARLNDIVNEGKSRVYMFFPHDSLSVLNGLYNNSVVLESEYLDSGVMVYAECEKPFLNKYDEYIQNAQNMRE